MADSFKNIAGKTTVRNDALARIASAVKQIREPQEAAHGYGCRDASGWKARTGVAAHG